MNEQQQWLAQSIVIRTDGTTIIPELIPDYHYVRLQRTVMEWKYASSPLKKRYRFSEILRAAATNGFIRSELISRGLVPVVDVVLGDYHKDPLAAIIKLN